MYIHELIISVCACNIYMSKLSIFNNLLSYRENEQKECYLSQLFY